MMLHHGRSNKYTFVHKGKKITLIPLIPAQIVQADREHAASLLDVPCDKDELVDDALALHIFRTSHLC